MPGDQVEELRLRDMAGRQLRPQVTKVHGRRAHVLFDDAEQRLVRFAAVIEAACWDAQPFLVDLRRIGCVGARHPPACIDMVADDGGKGDVHALMKDRLEDKQVRQVHAALIGIVQAVDIALADAVAIAVDHRAQRAGDRAQVPRQRQPLRHQPPIRRAKGGGGGAASGARL